MRLRHLTVFGALLLAAAGGCASAVDSDDALEPTGKADEPLLIDGFSVCSNRASQWISAASAAAEVLNDDCVSGWSYFPLVRPLLESRYSSLLTECSSSLSTTTRTTLSIVHSKLVSAAAVCATAANCHEAVDAYGDVASRLQTIVDGGCVDPDYWPLQWPTNSLFANAMDACWDFSAPDLYASVDDQIDTAALQVSHATECSKPQYAATRCPLVKVETLTRKKQIGGYSKEFYVELRTYSCPTATDVAMCTAIHPSTVSVDKGTYVIYGHKDVSVIENYCKVNGG